MVQTTNENQWIVDTIPLLKDLPPILQVAVFMFGAGWAIKQLANAGILSKKEARDIVPDYAQLPAPEIRSLPVSRLKVDVMRQYVALYDTLEQMKQIESQRERIDS